MEHLSKYLVSVGAIPVAPELMQPFIDEVRDKVIPAIIEYQQEQAVLMAKSRKVILF